MAVGKNVWEESKGKSVTLQLSATVEAMQVAVINNWVGMPVTGGKSGDMVAMSIEPIEYQFEVPASLTVQVGQVVCIDTTQVTGHTPADAAYNTNVPSATNLPLFKATRAKNANNIVTAIHLAGIRD